MSALFEELDYRVTPMGPISLRRRRVVSLDADVYEVMLGDEHLMSSLFTEGEIALARLGLAPVRGEALDVVVGGLGLGYTAKAVLDDPRVASVTVIETMPAVIEWHYDGLLPMGDALASDARCELVEGDFFALAAKAFDPRDRRRRYDAVLLDIDHSPRALLDATHGRFYSAAGLSGLAAQLKPDGVFAMWSDEGPDADFESALDEVFTDRDSHVVAFDNPLTGAKSTCTIYVARRRDQG